MHCPICNRDTTWDGNPTRPFCSERCKLVDLGRWASGHYRIPGQSLSVGTADSNDNGESPEPDT